MYKRIKRKKLGRKKTHRESLIRNLLRSLFASNYVVTTTPKAKVLKQEASSLIEKGKNVKDELSFRRELQRILGKEELVKKYFEYLKKEKVGVGFVRVGFRDGDNAEMARVSLLGLEKKKKKVEKEEKETKEKKQDEDSKVDKKLIERDVDKKVDKTAVIRKTERARTRAGI
ncbi:MAG: L17 family ribosomal protein [Bacteroidales bacterium]|jgi:large subunit ribosomal protein L17|nr:L17 family ribosomal protein [Bacteroidales bacterium]